MLVVAGAICWYLALLRLPVSFMLPVAALIAPVTAVGANLFLGETLTVGKACAILTIMGGVIWLGTQQSQL